ncbi:MAG: hypothetical protein Q9163_006306 [Psora crenata]
MLTSCLFTSLSIAASSFTLVSSQYLPDSTAATIRELEHLYLDAASQNLHSMITPCSQYVDSSTGKVNNNLGRQTAAEWIRVAFHDFVTANIYTDTGGLDASIGFETDRGENVGTAFNDALINFSYYFSKAVSMADLIALGTVLATSHCGGSPVSMRGGRVDAAVAGPTGVPQPQEDLQKQLVEFATAGFNRDDTIALTACGHTLGGVHKNIFPDVITDDSPGTVEGSDGRLPFDDSVAAFDVGTVNEYLQDTGARGGPLVTTTNTTVQSDLRLYSSDGNSTMRRLSQSNDYFVSQCSALFQRMIETVPGSVRLTNNVNPTTSSNLKPASVYLNVDWEGEMAVSGFFRYVQVGGAPTAPDSLQVALIGRDGQSTTDAATATKSSADLGTGIFGPTYQYPFTITFPASTGISGVTANGQTFAFQDTMFVVPGLSSVSPTAPAFVPTPELDATQDYSVNLTVAYLTTDAPATLTATFSVPQTQTGTVAPKIDSTTTTTLKVIGQTGPFAIYSAIMSKSLSAKQAYGSSVDVAVTGQNPGILFFKPFNKDA